MAQTTFSGPVTSNAGFNSDDILTSADYTNGGFNLTNFTVRPAATYANTVAALVGAVNQRTAGVSGGNMFGVYAQTSFSDNPTSTLTGLNTAVYGVVDCGSSTSIGTAYGATFDMAQFAGTRASRPKAFIAFGEESSATNPTEFLFDIGRPSKSVSTGSSGDVMFTSAACGATTGSLRIKINGVTRFIPLATDQL